MADGQIVLYVPTEVVSVTFRHVSECAVVELTLCEDLSATTVVAAWWAEDHIAKS